MRSFGWSTRVNLLGCPSQGKSTHLEKVRPYRGAEKIGLIFIVQAILCINDEQKSINR